MTLPPPSPCEPSVRAVLDALAFTTAAAHGDIGAARAVFADADPRTGEGSFAETLAATVQLLVDEAAVAGVDVTTALRDVGLGVQLAHLAEGATGHADEADARAPTDVDTEPADADPTRPDHGDV